MCSDPDLVTYSILEDLANDNYFLNESLNEIAQKRHEKYEGIRIGKAFAHLSYLALDYYYEAKLTYCYGFFKSSIFCSAAVMDFELKRALIKEYPSEAKVVENQTFGQSIYYLKEKGAPKDLLEVINILEWFNNVRNRISVHCARKQILISSIEDHSGPIDTSPLKYYFDKDEIKEIEKNYSDKEIDWLEELSLKMILEIRSFVEKGIADYLPPGSSRGNSDD